MSVTAKFVPPSVELVCDVPTTVTLRLHNNSDTTESVALSTSGEFGDRLALATPTATLESNQTVDIDVEIRVPATDAPAAHRPAVEIAAASGNELATLDIDVAAHRERTVQFRPLRSRGATVGTHTVRVVNLGNVAVTIDLEADDPGHQVTIEMPDSLAVDAGATREVEVRVVPATTYWSGPRIDHEFRIRVRDAVDPGTVPAPVEEFVGTFEQRPRVPNWIGPAAAGAAAALLIGVIAWFALLRPWIEDESDRAATEAIEADRAALRERIEELEAAAAEAEELPLGRPVDLRLDVAPAGGNAEDATETVDTDMQLSVTDVVFQNPTGAVGTVALLRNDDVLLQSELANFRDFDLHFVAPYVFESGDEISLRVECRTPGPNATDCPVGASVLGFIDEVD